jgi:dTDP-4-amino-4,6-dideoxygalactose transaminase
MPSFTFVSTANAVALRGGIPVFVDIRDDTLNIDETKIEEAITQKTKAIILVHYAGVACEMDMIMALAQKHNLLVIEDAAHALLSTYKNRPLGSIGDIACLSFHETKNIISGEGGAILLNNERFVEQAEITREKGTNRSQFMRGKVDKYRWVGLGSSYLPSELIAAFLMAQFDEAEQITKRRMDLWQHYHESFVELEAIGKLRRPIIPAGCTHNAHMYYVLLENEDERGTFIARLLDENIQSVFHYVPLHSAPAGEQYGRAQGELMVTNDLSSRIARLPLWLGLKNQQDRVIQAAKGLLA